MSAAEIKALTQPPSAQHAQSTALQWLDETFPSFDQFEDSDDLEQLVQHAAYEAEQSRTQVNALALPLDLRYLSGRHSSAGFLPGPRRLYHCPNVARRQCAPGDCPGTGAHPTFALGRAVVPV